MKRNFVPCLILGLCSPLLFSCQTGSTSSLPVDTNFLNLLSSKYQNSSYLQDGWFKIRTSFSRHLNNSNYQESTDYEIEKNTYFIGHLSFFDYTTESNEDNPLTKQIFASSNSFYQFNESEHSIINAPNYFITEYVFFSEGEYYSDMLVNYSGDSGASSSSNVGNVTYSQNLDPFRVSFQDFCYIEPSRFLTEATSRPQDLQAGNNTLIMYRNYQQDGFSSQKKIQWFFDEDLAFSYFCCFSSYDYGSELWVSTMEISPIRSTKINVPKPEHYGEEGVDYPEYSGSRVLVF